MALSMTGCGAGLASRGATSCRVEVRVINNRHFKLTLRGRDPVAAMESRVEGLVRTRIRRGTVHVDIDASGPDGRALRRIDPAQLASYLDELADFSAARGLPAVQSLEGLLSLPGVLLEVPADGTAAERLWPLVEESLRTALDGCDRMRRTEGDALTADMRATCQAIATLADGIRSRVPEVVTTHRDRLRERVARLLDSGSTVSTADVAREVALLADRSDIAEELVRLASHVEQFDRLLEEDSPGRTLDFLAQEMMREANTVASKSLDVAIAHAVVEIKTCIERLREQAQNVE
ncbi:MAG: YicC/YloC family endoribonuclease [Planctomycetaceae bacterium]